MATEKSRYTVSVDHDMFEKIENFRFSHRFQTRSEATVELIRRGLETLKEDNAENEPTVWDGVLLIGQAKQDDDLWIE